ncbi:hypothetical protein Bca52824_023930 [Brassica carinata]|uniref:Uncharacterized protein n=1 Tax=Brassica carinata TaxID=52824 RepID=A0A8X7VJN9_BRACI|nr:hypothetical protein Bca52824_023930 [Brassica carinata]
MLCNKKGERPPREPRDGYEKASKNKEGQTQEGEEQQVEVDTEVDDGENGSATSKINEGQTQEEEEQQVEDDTEVGDEGSETSKIIEHREVNGDASKEPVQVKKKKRVRENKGADTHL